MSDTTTRGIRIRVKPEYVAEQSLPQARRYLFAYHISIENLGGEAVQLLSRHWIITDGEGDTAEVRGDGVVGEQPRLSPGERFEYTSACPLPTPVGTMEGSFRMRIASGELFDAQISPFRLAQPGILH